MKLYVGNLPYSITDDSLRALFAPHGEVASASVVMDRASGRSKGFGFVEMPDSGAAATAMQALDRSTMDGRTIRVNEAVRKDR
ncbi:MAG: RNA-binding protein [Acidobacteria bacterium]|nr:RNA-binding protein [Acidobacteriota bacterium]